MSSASEKRPAPIARQSACGAQRRKSQCHPHVPKPLKPVVGSASKSSSLSHRAARRRCKRANTQSERLAPPASPRSPLVHFHTGTSSFERHLSASTPRPAPPLGRSRNVLQPCESYAGLPAARGGWRLVCRHGVRRHSVRVQRDHAQARDKWCVRASYLGPGGCQPVTVSALALVWRPRGALGRLRHLSALGGGHLLCFFGLFLATGLSNAVQHIFRFGACGSLRIIASNGTIILTGARRGVRAHALDDEALVWNGQEQAHSHP